MSSITNTNTNIASLFPIENEYTVHTQLSALNPPHPNTSTNRSTSPISLLSECDCRESSISISTTNSRDNPTNEISHENFQSALASTSTGENIQTRAYTWNELRYIISSNRLDQLGRCSHMQEFYRETVKQRLQKYETIVDYLKHTRFQYECECEQEREREQQQHESNTTTSISNHSNNTAENTNDSISSISSTSKLRVKCLANQPLSIQKKIILNLSLNEFSYCVSPSIQHYLLWATAKLSSAFLLVFIERYFPSSEYEVLCFVNPPQLMSIPDLFHAHYFIRKREQERDQQ